MMEMEIKFLFFNKYMILPDSEKAIFQRGEEGPSQVTLTNYECPRECEKQEVRKQGCKR